MRNRFAALNASGSIGVYNLNNELGKRIDPPVPVDKLFSAQTNHLLLKSEEKVCVLVVTHSQISFSMILNVSVASIQRGHSKSG